MCTVSKLLSHCFTGWTRYVWDFNDISAITLGASYQSLDYDGLLIKGFDGSAESHTVISSDHCLYLYSNSTTEANCVVYTPEYDGEMTVTFASTSNLADRICAIGTDVVRDINAQSTIAISMTV